MWPAKSMWQLGTGAYCQGVIHDALSNLPDLLQDLYHVGHRYRYARHSAVQ